MLYYKIYSKGGACSQSRLSFNSQFRDSKQHDSQELINFETRSWGTKIVVFDPLIDSHDEPARSGLAQVDYDALWRQNSDVTNSVPGVKFPWCAAYFEGKR